MKLDKQIPNLTTNAKESRPFSTADDVLASCLARGSAPGSVAVHLGTNGPPAASQFDDVMAAAGVGRRVSS